jgi:hypothetical protein
LETPPANIAAAEAKSCHQDSAHRPHKKTVGGIPEVDFVGVHIDPPRPQSASYVSTKEPWGTIANGFGGQSLRRKPPNGAYHYGNVFKLTHSKGSWTDTDLYDFTDASDGANPIGSLILDANENLYRTAVRVVFELTP